MKTTIHHISRIISALAAFSLVSALHGTTTPVAPVVTLTAYDNLPVDGTGNGHNAAGDNISSGEQDDANAKRLDRAVMVFSLPTLAEGEVLVSATLRFYVRTVSTDSATPDAILYHSQTQNRTTNNTAFYEDASYANTGLSAANTSMIASASAPLLVTLDVTQWVKIDYQLDSGSVVSSFRIQVDNLEFVDDNQSRRYSFFGKNSESYAPQLVIETGPAIPEPGHLALLFGATGLSGALVFRCCFRKGQALVVE
ncbi:hypothetical protein OPIT5_14760 [Opitutaceae bacterium TAV5]|nr:hypothetical protein OPIT5_14760 [Opitutaceae bacterium TAV5]